MEAERNITIDCKLGELLESIRAVGSADGMQTEAVGGEGEEEEGEGEEGAGGEGEEGAEEEDELEEEEDVDNDHTLRFQNGLTPLDLIEDDTPEFEVYEQLERRDYEVLAEKKRKALADNLCTHTQPVGLCFCQKRSEGSVKKARQIDVFGATQDEIMEAMNYGTRKKLRKSKKKGRRSGSKNKLSLKATQMLGDASLHYARGSYKEAIYILKEVVRTAPNFFPEACHILGLVHNAKGDINRALNFYLLAAYFSRNKSPLWRLLVVMSIEQGNTGLAKYCLLKAIRADPKDMTLRSLCASLYVELGEYQKAAESYIQISRICPVDVEALKMGSKLLLKCDQVEHSVKILEDYLNDHPTGYDLTVVDLLADICMENNAHDKALQHIKRAHQACCPIKEWPVSLTIKEGICHVHLGNVEKAECLFSVFQQQSADDQADLIKVADSYMIRGHYESALRYYLMLDGQDDSGYLHMKIGQCHLSLKERVKAIPFFYKALQTLDSNIDARLTLASILLEEAKDDEAILVLSPPKGSESTFDSNSGSSKPWWLDGEVKLKLSRIYLAKEKLEDFVDVIFDPVYDSLIFETNKRKKKKTKKKTNRTSTLREQAKLLDDQQIDCVIPVRPLATQANLSKAVRAKKSLQKRETRRQEKKAAALAAGLDWQSDYSDEEPPQQELRESAMPNLLKDEEHRRIIVDLSQALASLRRYQDAFKIINAALKLPYNLELESLGARIACKAKPGVVFNFLKRIVKLHPQSNASWNCYYNVVSRPEYQNQRQHSGFLHKMQDKCNDWAPPIIISGHRYTMLCQHQAAAREYFKALKLMPESPLINLCAGTALINLVLGLRLRNKHWCLLQGLAFLHINLQLCGHSQEALFNMARACHHIGMVSLAASYYEKVLATREKDYSIPKVPNLESSPTLVCCDIRKEAAYNLHLIYKQSGAFDLARQLLKDHCTF